MTHLIPTRVALGLLALSLNWPAFGAEPDLVIADFEGADYGAWTTTGAAFGTGPARGTLPNQMPVDGYLGKGLVNSFNGGDSSVGTLTSPEFKIERPYLQFLIGGGAHPGQTCINLLADGQVARTCTGPNDRPGGSERLDWQQWDVQELAGKVVRLQIVDDATGGWGHINVDQIIQTAQRLPGWITNATRQITVARRYLNIPVKMGAPKRLMRLMVDGQAAREFEIELADRAPDLWVFAELAPFRGKTMTLQLDKLREDSAGLASVTQSDEIRGAENLYQEDLRPQFHFTSRRGWNNDPNGLVFLDGEYHLFYQHNPYGWNWGNMHWGHAVSRDLVHWEELGEALYPDALGTMFSGSAVVDAQNTLGVGRPGDKILVCIYTAAGGTSPASRGQPFTQCLAYSRDHGRTWTKHAANPVLKHIIAENRDPKVFWHAPQKRWIMALYLDKNDYALFGSPDLKDWERLSDVRIPGTSECPEFFEIALDGANETRWVFYGGNGRYLVGTFDGRTFTPESGPHDLNFGNCFYASQTYNDLPPTDGRRIMVAWGQVNLPGMAFNQMMDFPVELTLRKTPDGPRLFTAPAREIERLRQSRVQVRDQVIEGARRPIPALTGELFDLTVELEPGDATEVGLVVRGVPITYRPAGQELSCLDKKVPLRLEDGRVRLRLLVDRASIEIFGNDGALYMPMGVILDKRMQAVELFATGGKARVRSLTGHKLKSAWPVTAAAGETP